MRRIALVVEYDGTDYAGFQLQTSVPSVQGALEAAIKRLTATVTRVYGAGRTDAGVHASGQVVCFDTVGNLAVDRFRTGLNYYLPEDVAVRGAFEVVAEFDPRRHAMARTYRYTMLESASRSPLRSRFVHHVGQRLDVASMNGALELLQGERDFAPFCGNMPQGGSTVRLMHRTEVWRQNGDEICLELEANAYLHQQIRRIAGAVLDVGLDRKTVNEFAAVADSNVHGAAARVLPAKGLSLLRVKYRDFQPLLGQLGAEQPKVTVG